MPSTDLLVTFIKGPTALIELLGLRVITDPTFDPTGTSCPTPYYTLRKTTAPAVAAHDLLQLTAVLLSHDHHFDNLDHLGRAMLPLATSVHTTRAGAERLARTWPNTRIVPLHFDGWQHFSEGRADIETAFGAAGLADRLVSCEPGVPRCIVLQ